ncbi:hypothetical protein D8B21_12035 [Verminephrobacter aporrectodeae subsp. tuberculatae]|nr:hypothetical protein [Verminephrobacter aporrectodeae subsp. tuberculatae]
MVRDLIVATQPRLTAQSINQNMNAHARNPARWSGATRNGSHIEAVSLNPERDAGLNQVVAERFVPRHRVPPLRFAPAFHRWRVD